MKQGERHSHASVLDLASARRRIASLHSDLRNEGMNPVEALRSIADTLMGDAEARLPLGHDSLLDLGTSALSALAFQEFISDDARSVFGQYLTPHVVAEHVRDLLSAELITGEFLDPFMGSGILLDVVADAKPGLQPYGCEINESVAHVGKASLCLAGHSVTLQIADAFATWLEGRLPRVNAVVTNPPFGAQATTVHRSQLSHTLAARTLGRTSKIPVELLALELCMDTLVDGGQLVIVLPQSVLTNNGWSAFRNEFFKTYTLRHVTSLPEATFAPFHGVAKACVLLIEKLRPANANYSFTYGDALRVGYDQTGRRSGQPDLSAIARKFHQGRLPLAALDQRGHVVYLRKDSDEGQDAISWPLGDIAEIFRGKNPSRDAYVESGPFLLKVGSLSGSFVSWRDRKRCRVPFEWFEKSQSKHLRRGDICFTASAHTPRYIGLKVDLISQLPPEGAMPSGEVIVVRLRPGAPFPPEALLYYMRSSQGYTQLQRLVRGSTAHLYPKDLSGVIIPDLGSKFDVETVAKLHCEAEESFRRYLSLEDEAKVTAGLSSSFILDDD